MLRSTKGFTLIELLIVVVIIGILAAIAIPKFSNTREKAYIASMKSDLRNLASAQESYFADNLTYTNDLGLMDFSASQGVTVAVTAASAQGWSATADHAGTDQTCALFNGVAAQAPATEEGVIHCA